MPCNFMIPCCDAEATLDVATGHRRAAIKCLATSSSFFIFRSNLLHTTLAKALCAVEFGALSVTPCFRGSASAPSLSCSGILPGPMFCTSRSPNGLKGTVSHVK